MTFQQQKLSARETPAAVSPDVALAATRYQHHRAIEAKQLAVMASHNLVVDWNAETHAAVLEARVHVRAAREARAAFRTLVGRYVRALLVDAVPLSAVLAHTRAMLQALEASGAIDDDGGWLEAEVLEWAIEDYQVLE